MGPLDAKLLYWTGALANMLLLIGCAASGVRAIRRGDVATHRRRMLLASGLVVVFLVSYVAKVAWLGREVLELWGTRFRWVLRFHELCVLSMVAGGALALRQAHRLALAQRRASDFDAVGKAAGMRLHRRAGWTALAAGVLGVASAAYVLYGMYLRAGLAAE